MGGSRCHTELFLLENHPKIAIYVYQLNTMFRSSRPTMSIMFDYTLLMLVSHCGEYPCECNKIYSQQIRHIVANIWRMGLRMQFATNRNDRKMILVGVRKHSRSFVWRCEYYATLTLWRISCECKTFIFAAYSLEMIRLPRRITEKVRPFIWLRMPANFLRSLRSVCRISG